MPYYRLLLSYWRTPDRNRKMSNSFDMELDGGNEATVGLASDIAQGLKRLLANFQEIVSWKYYELVYDGTKGKWVTRLPVSGGDFAVPIEGTLNVLATTGERRVCGDGVFILQKDNTGRDAGRMLVRGMLTEGSTGSTDGNSYPVNPYISAALANAMSNEWQFMINTSATPGAGGFIVCHAGSKGVKVGYVNSMKAVRMKQYRGAKPVGS